MYKKRRVNSNSRIISTDEDPSLRIESSAIINLRGVSTKLNKYIVFTMQTYKKQITCNFLFLICVCKWTVRSTKLTESKATNQHNAAKGTAIII